MNNSILRLKECGGNFSDEYSLNSYTTNRVFLQVKPYEQYTQIMQCDFDFLNNLNCKLFNSQNNEVSGLNYNIASYTGDNGQYVVLNFRINNDFNDECLYIRIIDEQDTSMITQMFTCTNINTDATTLITYRHNADHYGIPYSQFKDMYQQIRIPMWFAKKIQSADAETYQKIDSTPVFEEVGRVKRVLKDVYNIFFDDFYNEALGIVFDSDNIYFDRIKHICSPYVPEELEDGYDFTISKVEVQKTNEYFNGSINIPETSIFKLLSVTPLHNSINTVPVTQLVLTFNKNIVLAPNGTTNAFILINRRVEGSLNVGWQNYVAGGSYFQIHNKQLILTLSAPITTSGIYYIAIGENLIKSVDGENYNGITITETLAGNGWQFTLDYNLDITEYHPNSNEQWGQSRKIEITFNFPIKKNTTGSIRIFNSGQIQSSTIDVNSSYVTISGYTAIINIPFWMYQLSDGSNYWFVEISSGTFKTLDNLKENEYKLLPL